MSADFSLRKSSSIYSSGGVGSDFKHEGGKGHISTDSKPYRATSYYSTFNDAEGVRKSSSQYFTASEDELGSEEFWKSVVGDAAYFTGQDPLFGDVIVAIYKTQSSDNLSSLIISKHGQTLLPTVNTGKNSVYYPAIKNLASREMKRSKVRKCLAVSMLKIYSMLDQSVVACMLKQVDIPLQFDWDETMAGSLASRMELVHGKTPHDIGNYLLSLGYFRDCQRTDSHVIDVVYENAPEDEEMVDKNNALAYLLGEQLEHLFDPLMEYSPEPTEKTYNPPAVSPELAVPVGGEDGILAKSVCNELVNFQTNFTVSLVQFLQKFIVPLRVKVLEGQIDDYTTSKLNQIFPPTIDEVTRINCIFLDMLKLAQPYGCFELLKACGTTIPYFYKACMRHEAATKRFSEEYDQLVADLKAMGKEDFLTYDSKTTQSIITSSSLNLVKIQLILQRMMKTKDWSKCSNSEKDEVDRLYHSCNDTITSFASDKLSPYNHRIFTPTGKILTELTNSWPTEIQYGWLNRRVVAVFDIEFMLSDDVKNRGALVIFSDYILLLEIDDNEYYCQLWNAELKSDEHLKVHRPSISDILMHSLVNEVPVTGLPHIRVKNYCKIDEVIASHYSHDQYSFVKLLADNFAGQYKIARFSGKYVVDLISKAQILNKSCAFHLFKNDFGDSTFYYAAHELSSYKEEEVKSPILVLFNTEFNPEILNEHNLFGFITLNFVSQEKIRMEGMTRSTSKFDHVVAAEQLTESLAEKITDIFNPYCSLDNPITRSEILKDNGRIVAGATRVILRSNRTEANDRLAILQSVQEIGKGQMVTEEAKQSNPGRRSLDALVKYETKRINSIKTSKVEEKKTKRGFFRKFFRGRIKDHAKANALAGVPSPKPIVTRKIDAVQDHFEKHEIPLVSSPPETSKSCEEKEKGQEVLEHSRTGTVADSTASTSIYVNSQFEFPPRDVIAPTKESQIPRTPKEKAEPATDVRPSFSKIHRVSSSLHLHRRLSVVDKDKPATPVIETGVIPQSGTVVRRPQNTKLETAIPADQNQSIKIPQHLPAREAELVNVNSLPHQKAVLTRSESYYDKFKKTRKIQEETIRVNGIAAVTDETQSALSGGTIIYSPSVRVKLSRLAHILENGEDDNWTTLPSRDNMNSIVGGATAASGGLLQSDEGGLDEDAIQLELVNSLQISSTEGQDDFYDSLHNYRYGDDDSATVKMAGDSGSSGDALTLKTAQWSEVDVNAILAGSNESSNTLATVLHHQKEDELDEYAYMVGPDSLLKEFSDISASPPTKENPPDLTTSSRYSDEGYDETSLCSALKDIKDTSQAGIIVNLADGRLLFPSESSVTVCDLIGDESYDYLGQILAGNIRIGDGTISRSGSKTDTERTTDSDYDRINAEQLSESSYNYLASLIGSGEQAVRV
ncbi:DEKNAAC101668 [Brettanomyces naardenensis]|uniref:DEKNAAC101668 n=1 Tax=Brettanomyces naardenensis TaxID=13370 RepID=A0A448YIQ7_BRENA|nr:DEKNAAC101668 [Brettanomyces naardenensis]